ncbi:helix-turn-helix domain-containing protein, partial [Tepidibacillus infernus]|uniref:helix-turn-helix domain-containing protein n=1 Tax=Tepidibacillus infernus TaxID=1806172 RepID=UPI003B724842
MHIGNRIKKLRESLGIKRKDFASGVISYSHLSNIEVGKNGASEEILIAIEKKLNVPKEYLTRYKDIDHDLETKLSSLKANLDLK